MLTTLVASSKGGCGKTTLVTQLATHWAQTGKQTAVIDADRQHSQLALGRSPSRERTRHYRHRRQPQGFRPPAGRRAAGHRGYPRRRGRKRPRTLSRTRRCHHRPRPALPFRPGCDPRLPYDAARHQPGKAWEIARRSRRQPPETMDQRQPGRHRRTGRTCSFPVVAELRDSQAYVLLTALGKGIFDYHSENVRGHQEDWAKLLRWIKRST